MTAPQDPLVMTLEEGLSLAKKYMVAYLEESWWPYELREKWPEDLDADYRTLFERPVVARDEAAELRDRIAELERTNFALSEDSALVANENAELTESLKRLLDAVRGTDGHMGLIDMIDGYYGPCLGDAEAAIARAQAALAATEGES